MIIRFKADEIVYIKPGDEVLGVRVIGIPPIPIGIDENKAIREKTKSDIAERNRVRDNEKALMATEEQTSSAK